MARRLVCSLIAAAGFMGATAEAKVLPDNNLYLMDRRDAGTGITQDQFNAVIDRAEKYFKPIIQGFGGTYTVARNWDDATVNANADQDTPGIWHVNMYGGLARRAEVTVDGFAMVLCHETGHHLGGFPFISDWAADEGQADYFAVSHCARTIFKDEPVENAKAAATVDPTAKAQCDQATAVQAERDLCYRTMNASWSLANLLAALEGATVSFSTHDPAVVAVTDDNHPAAQCRLDTYVAGAVCTAAYDSTVIPGKVGAVGGTDAAAETASEQYNCEDPAKFTQGFRPACWFHPGI